MHMEQARFTPVPAGVDEDAIESFPLRAARLTCCEPGDDEAAARQARFFCPRSSCGRGAQVREPAIRAAPDEHHVDGLVADRRNRR